MKRLLVMASVAGPPSLLLLFRLFPELDPTWSAPVLHFYLVTFITFTASVVALLTVALLGAERAARHRLLATAFAVMAAIFLIHGITTPQAIIHTFHPGIRWAAWLTLLSGGVVFALAALDGPDRVLPPRSVRRIQVTLLVSTTAFVLIAAFAPRWLTAIDRQTAPWHEVTVYLVTLLSWLWAAFRLTKTWRTTGKAIDGIMALTAAWLATATVSLHSFTLWQLSWWLYHFLLLAGVVTAVTFLALEYEQLRRFRLTYYYGAVGLIFLVALTLLASHFFSSYVAQNLVPFLTEIEIGNRVISARLRGLVIAGSSLGLFYFFILAVVSRADRLIRARTSELAQAYSDLRAAEAMRDDLTDMIVHDLRAPLTSIGLSLGLLKVAIADPGRRAKREQLLQRAQAGVQRMVTLVNQLLDVARLESGKLEAELQPVAIAALLEEKVMNYTPLADSEGKQIEVDVGHDLPSLPADQELVSRILDNLIVNALKYTAEGGLVSLRAMQDDGAITVQIIDDGEGIDPAVSSRIFDKFYQVKGADGKAMREGIGLGLTFCKLAIEAHGGRIWVEGEPGRGSTFSFSLPLNGTDSS